MILNLEAYDLNFLAFFAIRFAVNFVFAYILICVIYANEHRIKEFSFSFFVSNILIFTAASLLASVKIKTGFAFGLFAIISILRFRTEQIQVREMTFLFAAIILGVINSLATMELPIVAVLLADGLICGGIFFCENMFIRANSAQTIIIYDNTKLLAKDKKVELYADLKQRFGYDVLKIVIEKVNFLTDSAELKVFYKHR
ncbi:MAG: DUF4956 domain-containing protein [Chitinivibrionia bacterium]|nr:DUF4956 domain-containing protein [Chitinivibrionia bacterium]